MYYKKTSMFCQTRRLIWWYFIVDILWRICVLHVSVFRLAVRHKMKLHFLAWSAGFSFGFYLLPFSKHHPPGWCCPASHRGEGKCFTKETFSFHHVLSREEFICGSSGGSQIVVFFSNSGGKADRPNWLLEFCRGFPIGTKVTSQSGFMFFRFQCIQLSPPF